MKRIGLNHMRTAFKLLATTVVFAHIATSAYATDISDVPMAVKNVVAPNIMFMIDNSGSMNNIVPDAPFNPATTYLASCPAGNIVAGGVAGPGLPADSLRVDIRIESGVPKMRRSIIGGTTGPSNLTSGTFYDYGTGTGKRCFDTALRYNVRLYGDSCSGSICTPSGYLDAVYEGNYLNWYFGNPATSYTTELNYGSGAIRNKPGTVRRLDATKTASKAVIDSLNNVRVGLSTYSSATSGDFGELLEIMGPISGNRTRVKSKIDAIPPFGNTPLAETLYDLGGYFAIGNTGNLTLHPGQANQSTDTVANVFSHSIRNNTNIIGTGTQTIVPPIQYFCQKSFTVLMTDGRPQGDRGVSAALRDYSGECAAGQCNATPNTANIPSGSNPTPPNTLTAAEAAAAQNGTKAGRGYENQGSDYLDDVAHGLYEMDLRPDLTNPSGAAKKNNLLTYPIGFAEIQLIGDPLLRNTADKGQGAAAGQGLNLVASNASSLVSAFQLAAEDILSKDGAAAAVAVANANVTSGDNASYASSYNSGTWTGDLNAYPIDLSTGNVIATTSLWTSGSAQAQLDLRTPASRKIVSYTGTAGSGQGIQFQPVSASTVTKLSGAQQALLNTPVSPPGPTDGASVVAYLRGERSGETSLPSLYRTRLHLLGDIINAEPVVVRSPQTKYADAGFAAFKTLHTTTTPRQKMVYQAANDSMLHAFNADTGAEEWAYIPNLLIPNLNNLSRKSGFVHKFYVDGTPASGDVDFGNTGGTVGSPDWHTILVGGLRKGGRGYYALDVTQPIATDEAAVAAKVMWEFPNSGTTSTNRLNVGYSYSKPIIVKTKAAGWVALVTSGYNNGTGVDNSDGDGQGYLFVLNAKTGAVISAISTGVGSVSDPSGLAQISGYVENGNIDNTIEYVYGGDLKGNVWRFDLTGATVGSWNVAKLAALVDAGGAFQPITSAPELAKIKINGANKRFVYVGTGLYLHDNDVPGGASPNSHATQTQTMYALVDDLGAEINPLRTNLQQQTVASSTATTRDYSQNQVDYTTKKGWYLDLPVSGERANTDPQLTFGALVFTSNIPNTTPCIPGGSSWVNFVDYKTGGYVTGTPVSPSAIFLGNSLASRPVLVKLPNGSVKAIIQTSDTSATDASGNATRGIVTTSVPTPPPANATRRVLWREIQE